MSNSDNNEQRIDIINEMDAEISQIIKDDYINTVRKLTGVDTTCMKLSIFLAVGAFIFTGAGSVLAFASGYLKNDYASFAAGCSNVVAMILMKASYYASSQSHYHDVKLRSHLTKDYRFVRDFIHDPLSLRPVNDPSLPDPMQMTTLDSSPSRPHLLSMANMQRPAKSKTKKTVTLDDTAPREVPNTDTNLGTDPMIDTEGSGKTIHTENDLLEVLVVKTNPSDPDPHHIPSKDNGAGGLHVTQTESHIP
jgi:hypothetical protein